MADRARRSTHVHQLTLGKPVQGPDPNQGCLGPKAARRRHETGDHHPLRPTRLARYEVSDRAALQAGCGPSTYAERLSELPPRTRRFLYLHVAFCEELCPYWGCHTMAARTYSPAASYVELLEREVELVAGHLPGRMGVTHIHWGGGTPANLSGSDLRRIMGPLEQSSHIRAGAGIAVEIDPRTPTLEHVEALAAPGLNRAGLGVQGYNPRTPNAINRIQS